MSILTAEWRKLAMANYVIDPRLLEPYVPAGTELDLWKDRCYVSLVGFMFLNTRLLGLPIPFHRNFEEVNLRFYVRRKEAGEWKRGVVFIKEIVPKPAITFVANTIYKEHYETMKMSHQWIEHSGDLQVVYRWGEKDKQHHFSILADGIPHLMKSGSEEEFIAEHYWGYAKSEPDKTNEYEVKHPKWTVYPVKDFEVEVDFGVLYGSVFSILNHQKPESVLLAEGSEISVQNKRILVTA